MSARRTAVVLALLAAAGCGSTPTDPPLDPQEVAPPRVAQQNRNAVEAPEFATQPSEGSTSRPLAYVNGDVVTYRDVLLRVGPQLAVLGEDEQKRTLEEQALLDIVRDRIIQGAAEEAGVIVTRDQVDGEQSRRVRDLERNGGTLSAFLAERGMTRREYMERVRREIQMQSYMLAAIGLTGGSARVRPMTDTFVAPGDVRKYYERNPEKFEQHEHAKVRVMGFRANLRAEDRQAAIAAARNQAERSLQRLRAGEDWVPVYRANLPPDSEDDSDGLLVLVRGDKAAWIEDFAFDSPRGTYSDVIKKGNTFYVMRAEGAEPHRVLPYEEVREKIRSTLSSSKRQVATYEVELRLLEQAAVQPESLSRQLRRVLRASRRKLIDNYGL